MSIFVYGFTTQHVTYGNTGPGSTYQSHPCGGPTVICPNNDWVIDPNISCGLFESDQQACSHTLPTLCPSISGEGSAQWADDGAYNSLNQGRKVKCVYQLQDFQNADDLTKFTNEFGFNDSYNNVIMPNFCAQKELDNSTCPLFPISPTGGVQCGTGLTGCSRMTSSSSDGIACQNWANNNVKLAQGASKEYCLNTSNTCSTDCLCYNRGAVDPTYFEIIKQGAALPTVAACWYQPCQLDQYLIPADQNIDQANVCPTTICEQVVQIVNNKNSNIDVNIAKEEISCNTNSSQGGNNTTYLSTLWSQYYIYFIIGISLFVIIVVILIILSFPATAPTQSPTQSLNNK